MPPVQGAMLHQYQLSIGVRLCDAWVDWAWHAAFGGLSAASRCIHACVLCQFSCCTSAKGTIQLTFWPSCYVHQHVLAQCGLPAMSCVIQVCQMPHVASGQTLSRMGPVEGCRHVGFHRLVSGKMLHEARLAVHLHKAYAISPHLCTHAASCSLVPSTSTSAVPPVV